MKGIVASIVTDWGKWRRWFCQHYREMPMYAAEEDNLIFVSDDEQTLPSTTVAHNN